MSTTSNPGPSSACPSAYRLPRAHSAQGTVVLPGSKSISNRVLLLAALARGSTELSGLLDSDDTRVMLAALRQLGVSMSQGGNGRLRVEGGLQARSKAARSQAAGAQDAGSSQQPLSLFLGNAGTAFRPLTAVLALLGGHYHLHGVPRMHERPIGDLVQALRQLGADIRHTGQPGCPPLDIRTAPIRAQAPIRVKGSVSSQFLTALLLAAPLVASVDGQPLVIEVEGELISRPYILMTLNLMQRFGVTVQRDENWQRFVVPPAAYVSPGALHVEGDASSASYFMALGAIGGGPVRIEGVGADSIQGDVAFAGVIQRMGARVDVQADAMTVSGVQVKNGARLRAFDEDFNLIPDAAMTAAALAVYADGPCTLRNIGSWRVKETDRIHAMQTELGKLGARAESGNDWLRVHPINPKDWRSAAIATYDDHRMAMCFSLAAFGGESGGASGGVDISILDPACVSKTFPDYFAVFERLVQA